MTRRKTHEEFVAEVEALVGYEYSVIGEYIDSRTKIKMKHNKCSHIYEVKPNVFTSGCRCPKCKHSSMSDKFSKSTKTFKNEVFDLVGEDYEVIGNYVNARTKIKMKHCVCSHVYEVTPSNFLQNKRCPRCNESKGERKINCTLQSLNLNFKHWYKIAECKNKYPLPFDFAVFSNSGGLLCLIEYDGEQHFHAVGRFGGMRGFYNRKRRDEIKTQYCADNNIPLIRIPYWDFDIIDEILTKELRKLGVIETQDIAA